MNASSNLVETIRASRDLSRVVWTALPSQSFDFAAGGIDDDSTPSGVGFPARGLPHGFVAQSPPLRLFQAAGMNLNQPVNRISKT